MSLFDAYSVVSSANSIDLEFIPHLAKSLIYMMNSKGPSTEPYGTPYFEIL